MKFLMTVLAFVFCFSAVASPEAEQLVKEFNSLKQWALEQEMDGVVGGLYPYVQQDGYIVMFSKEFDGEHDVIRFFLGRSAPQKDFAVSYYWSRYMFEGRRVLRRFVGPEPTGWRNDTVDVDTFEYLGRQGRSELSLSDEELEILEAWGIELL
ncbi:MAG: hypothetical protein AAF202_04765 [Pseudomonadota bacterium]